jgi:hypothetical protein
MSTEPQATIKGHHGTDMTRFEGIKKNNFERSAKPEWLGQGAYFFTDGISSLGPQEDAINWARACVACFGERYPYWAVVTAEINTQKMLDLTDETQLKFFNKMRDVLYRRFNFRPRGQGQKGDRDWILDVEIIEEIRKETEIWAAKCHFFFKFTLENQRSIGSRIPNVTIVCVYEPERAIDKDSIKNPRSGQIK